MTESIINYSSVRTAVLRPAYGRQYKQASEILDDWLGNKDFVLCGLVREEYCNKLDLRQYTDYTHVELRFGKNLSELVVMPIIGDEDIH